MDDFLLLIIAAVAIGVIISIMQSTRASKTTQATQSASSAKRQEMVQDIKSTKTSRVVDAVEILDDLGTTSNNYRHYCELVGTSQASEGVTAPYSQQQVAYYDIRCYRIDHQNGRDVETLVAHERSTAPFYFTDGSSDTRVYVDLASFGENVTLLNSTNHIEGPNSEFSKAMQSKVSSAVSGSSTSYRTSYAVGGLRDKLERLTSVIDSLLLPGGFPAMQPGLAAAGAVVAGNRGSIGTQSSLGSNLMLSEWKDVLGSGKNASRGASGMGGRPSGGFSRPSSGHGRTSMPQGLGDFLGGSMGQGRVPGGYGVPRQSYNPYRGSSYRGYSLGDAMLDIGLGALIGSMRRSAFDMGYSMTSGTSTQRPTTPVQPVSTFRGYRLVEDVVPLASPTYCIGEIYRNSDKVYMGRSLAEDYPTSYFATKAESELLADLGD